MKIEPAVSVFGEDPIQPKSIEVDVEIEPAAEVLNHRQRPCPTVVDAIPLGRRRYRSSQARACIGRRNS